MVYLLHCQRLEFRESFKLAAMLPLKGSSASSSFAFLPTHRWRKLPLPPFVERKPERRRAPCRDRWRHLSRGLQCSRCTTHSLLLGQSRFFFAFVCARAGFCGFSICCFAFCSHTCYSSAYLQSSHDSFALRRKKLGAACGWAFPTRNVLERSASRTRHISQGRPAPWRG